VLAEEEQSLEWVGDAEVDLDWSYDLDLEEDEEEEVSVQEVKSSTKKTIVSNLYNNEDLDFTQGDLAELLEMSKRDVNDAVN